jgi:hypothetical protein
MDRRAKKLEKKRKSREQTKKNARALATQKSKELARLARSAGSAAFGPCYVSEGWDDLTSPALVTVVVTRQLSTRHLVPAIALVDRTCLGVKNAFPREPMLEGEFEDLLDDIGTAHGGMVRCDPLFAQSIVFHAIDYARSLGFEPHPDFPAALFGPRPAELLPTAWHAPERPIYMSGPHDNAPVIMSRLREALGDGGFEFTTRALSHLDDDDVGFDDDDDDDDEALVHSALERTVSRDGASLRISIYRGPSDAGWILEIVDQLNGSTVWDEPFETDRAALEAALLAIEEDGAESFAVG